LLGAELGYTDTYYPNAAYGGPLSNGQLPLLNGAGDKLTNVIPWTAAVNVQYSLAIGNLWSDATSYVRLDYRWQDAAPWANPMANGYDPAAPAGPTYSPAYSTLNVRVGIKHGRLDISAYVNNATNANPRLNYYRYDEIGDPLFYAAALRPLTAGLAGWYRF
jgi:hypothetical protein